MNTLCIAAVPASDRKHYTAQMYHKKVNFYKINTLKKAGLFIENGKSKKIRFFGEKVAEIAD
ncbi:MAG: hypothetical protein ACMUJM_24600 [bacterium]